MQADKSRRVSHAGNFLPADTAPLFSGMHEPSCCIYDVRIVQCLRKQSRSGSLIHPGETSDPKNYGLEKPRGPSCGPKGPMVTENFISVIIPVHNGGATIGRCLEAVFASRYPRFEVIAVDDRSTDNSPDIISRYPCTLVRLETHAGASAARNAGARRSTGDYLFFIDADCILQEDTLTLVNDALTGAGPVIVGGTYTPLPFDSGFFSAFQSVFIHYSETKRRTPDYIATHALAVQADLFRRSGGFTEDFLPILEDVEFSHRLRRLGYRLVMDPRIQVRHIFNFTLLRSIRNAYRKSRYWTVYSLGARDLLADSGTASREMKVNGACLLVSGTFLALGIVMQHALFPALILLVTGWNAYLSRKLLAAFFRAGGLPFAVLATLYYLTLYPAAALAGAARGMLSWRETSIPPRGAGA